MSKNFSNVFMSRPGWAHSNTPDSWSTTTVQYLWPRLMISSIPIRVSPVNRSVLACASATTRVTIDPTVRQEIRSRSRTADLLQCVTNQAAVSSKA